MTTDRTEFDYSQITERQQGTWKKGDFSRIAQQTIPMSARLVKDVDPHAGERLLDVACGTGNAAIISARRYCAVSGLDYVPALIEQARRRAAVEGLDVDFHVGDAQDLPFSDSEFDAVVSTLGIMFAPDQEKAASELLRVCRSGGKIGLGSWTPDGFGGDFFRAHAQFLPDPPAQQRPAVRWGTEEGIDELIGSGASSISNERLSFDVMFARSVEHGMEILREYFGPTIQVFELTEEKDHQEAYDAIANVLKRYNRATDGTLALNAEYLQTIAIRA